MGDVGPDSGMRRQRKERFGFFKSPIAISQCRRLCVGGNQPPFTHRLHYSPSAQARSLSSSMSQ
jgi:hypothetical protein